MTLKRLLQKFESADFEYVQIMFTNKKFEQERRIYTKEEFFCGNLYKDYPRFDEASIRVLPYCPPGKERSSMLCIYMPEKKIEDIREARDAIDLLQYELADEKEITRSVFNCLRYASEKLRYKDVLKKRYGEETLKKVNKIYYGVKAPQCEHDFLTAAAYELFYEFLTNGYDLDDIGVGNSDIEIRREIERQMSEDDIECFREELGLEEEDEFPMNEFVDKYVDQVYEMFSKHPKSTGFEAISKSYSDLLKKCQNGDFPFGGTLVEVKMNLYDGEREEIVLQEFPDRLQELKKEDK